MTQPGEPITLDVDLSNPGQFLASCGLFELASRLDAEAMAWFGDDTFTVSLAAPRKLLRLMKCSARTVALETYALSDDAPEVDDEASQQDKSAPIHLGSPIELTLDWWTEPTMTVAGFKTWAGGQHVEGFIAGMRENLRSRVPTESSRRPPRGKQPRTPRRLPFNSALLSVVLPISKPKPFYFDSRISRLTSLDLGFSAEKFTTAYSPAVELLALIGMQRFRPATVVHRERYAYCTWRDPLPVAAAGAVAAGLIPTLADRRYTFPLVVRTGGKYKAFGPATLERSAS